MDIEKTFIGTTEDEIWQQVAADINDEVLEYHALLKQADTEIYLDIDIDLGGGFEGGYATTAYRALLSQHDFKFAVHEEDFTDEIGKFFGMQDVETGYEDLDHHLIIKTNNEAKVKTLFIDANVRRVFTTLEDFDLGIRTHSVDDSDEKQTFLELNIEDGITDAVTLREIYRAFYTVLKSI
ncbi:hypothetical protein BDD43_5224 [Mucilaginibacter gracilis]|uniref:Uncharacterized protein n=1 Tax=Mucilaginibacter gracilis TaxID=423350 RepID=A0A495J7K1_9SPHI|nr:hypothetical protein [Mucilaginibacter gracilis]RKR84970.1 hypothetical protein BDD43_5224 [Mucilaginibacter gracilis]